MQLYNYRRNQAQFSATVQPGILINTYHFPTLSQILRTLAAQERKIPKRYQVICYQITTEIKILISHITNLHKDFLYKTTHLCNSLPADTTELHSFQEFQLGSM